MECKLADKSFTEFGLNSIDIVIISMSIEEFLMKMIEIMPLQ